MRFTIDGKTIEAKVGQSVLDASLAAGIYIPHLCKHPDLEAAGECRLCSVEVDGIEEAVPACKTEVKDEMKVTINGEKADKVRKMAMELMLATHPAECTGCPKYGKCELQSMYQYMGVSPERWRKKSRVTPNNDSNPLISHLFTRCVRCGRCIRACRDLRGANVLDYQVTKSGVRAGVKDDAALKEAGCKFCGACIEVCPTGSIMDAPQFMKEGSSYSDLVVPCRAACPAHIDIPRYIRYIKNGELNKALAVVREKVPFPETLGSICNHACETDCKRNELGSPISICRLKLVAASLGDESWKLNAMRLLPTGRKVAIIGSGPTGLTAAYYLAEKGHEVVIFEENEKAGGQCRYGIPAYRLPDELLDREISDILEIGITLKTNMKVDTPKQLLEKGYDAVLIAVGTHQGSVSPIEGHDLRGVYVNTDFLKQARLGTPRAVGDKVMVLGGGNVAYDCARTAIRLGAKEVHIACLENEKQMTATKEEIEEGAKEGIILHNARSFFRITGETRVTGVELQKIENFYFDENNKAVLELVEDAKEIIPADHVIFAIGQKPAGTAMMELELVYGSYIKVDETLATSMSGVYAAGDVVTGTKSVIEAIQAGRISAQEIDKYLGQDGDINEELIKPEIADPFIGESKEFADLQRQDSAQAEASRCLQCDLRLQLENPKLWTDY